jgi:pimeloyl-ACP methyl ester carboxylesterase
MSLSKAPEAPGTVPLTIFFGVCVAILIGAVFVASQIQKDFGRVRVANVYYKNFNGIPIRAKLFRPRTVNASQPGPGIVYAHGYQNNRETSDAYCLELARRGFVVLGIDAIGRGNSGNPNGPKAPDFDRTYGVFSSLQYLRGQPYVNPESLGLMGHSLGAEWAYSVALKDPGVKALVISGFAYRMDATASNPKNMLMIIGKYDEYRKRMTGVRDIERDWMRTPQTRRVIPFENPRINETYGDFSLGTARRVFVPPVTHVQESHNRTAIAEALVWMKAALDPDEKAWIDPHKQIWPVKEWATLAAMLAGLASILPLGAMLMKLSFFSGIPRPIASTYTCTSRSFFKIAGLNAVLLWLYLPLIFILFGLHVYAVRIDRIFPLMMVNGTVWWFFWINVIGFFIFKRWYRRKRRDSGVTLRDLGVSDRKDGFGLDGGVLAKTVVLGLLLFFFAYGCEHLLERIFIVDYRFIFPFASDLTPYRAAFCLIYFPFLLAGFLGTGILLHGQLRRPPKKTWTGTFVSWSLANLFALAAPLILFLGVQYVPLFTTGFIPFVGPGGMFVTFVLNLFHIIMVLLMAVPVSTWFFQLTGKIYLGAWVNACLVTWMFVSSQVIAPIPV